MRFWPFKGSGQAPQRRVVVPHINPLPKIVAMRSALKRRVPAGYPRVGMWVRYGSRTGILKGITPGDVATVMLVDDKGENVSDIFVPANTLRQAYVDEIPVPRRPTRAQAELLGYLR